jgi:hypothetical protein
VAQLPSLLWHALDTDDDARALLIARHGWSGDTGKALVGDDPARINLAYSVVESSAVARRAYQDGFKQLDNQRTVQPSPAHAALAELLHRRIIETVISFNWDTLLEAAYRRSYGGGLHADGDWLHKPHGDAAHPEADWILPHQTGYVPPALLDQIGAMVTERPRVLLVVGYSESDEEVVQKLTGPLAGQWRVVRVGPGATGDGAVPLTADEALPALLRAISSEPEVPGWEYVTFEQQHDLGYALSGRRLGPADVRDCPRLPEVSEVTRLLSVAHSAVLTGRSGGGKSITAYQAAHDLTCGLIDQTLWEVVRLVEPQRSTNELLDALAALPRPTIALVDDAQSVDSHFIRRLMERATPALSVLIVSTENALQNSVVAGSEVQIACKRGIAFLAEALKQRRAETLAIVRQYDDHVGDDHLDRPLEYRLEEAARCETPWQFIFALTGGWRRARQQLAELRDHDGADVLLAAVAAGQLVSLDAGASRDYLQRCAWLLGRDEYWLNSRLALLQSRRLVWGEDALRCPHLQFANVVLEVFFHYGENAPPREAKHDAIRVLYAAL